MGGALSGSRLGRYGAGMRRRRLMRAPCLSGLLVLILVLAACGGSGDDDSGTGASAPTTSTSSTSESSESDAANDAPTRPGPTFHTDDFGDGDPIPVELTCDGVDRSPQLSWGFFPDDFFDTDTATAAVVVDDVDAPGGSFVHWTMWDLEAGATVDGGSIPPDAVEGENDAATVGWTGPCPPPGDGPHAYVFTLFALSTPLDVDAGASPDEARDALDAAGAVEVATFTGTYER